MVNQSWIPEGEMFEHRIDDDQGTRKGGRNHFTQRTPRPPAAFPMINYSALAK